MRIGIGNKLSISFFSLLILPIFAVLVTGFNTQNTPTVVSLVPILLALLIPFCMCALILGWIIASNIIKPLQELNAATKNIMDGNFEFGFHYHKNNEMGDLCAAFDSMRKQLKTSLEKQAVLEASRKELIASISHDLRTPMTSIKGYVEGLQDGIIHDKAKFNRYITVIKNKTESLDHLIERLFQYSQLDINDQSERHCVRDSKELLETVITPIEMEFADQSFELNVIKPFPSVHIIADENGLTQVLDNLISNAKRYAARNGTITIEAKAEGDDLKISVTDNGSGIAQADLPHVFEQFYRSEKSRSRNYGGAGLGLAICKKIVENQGGSIQVASIPDVRTTFCFTIPLAR